MRLFQFKENLLMCVYTEAYDKHKNLKIAAKELDMPWQTLYWYLKKLDHPVEGDKAKYGSLTDKMARYAEELFIKSVPHAVDHNKTTFQAKEDFTVNGYSVDVKSSCKKDGGSNLNKKNFRWAFSTKVQEKVHTDFIVCYCFEEYDNQDAYTVAKTLLIPNEFFTNKQSISVSCIKSKWYDFEVTEQELTAFFKEL